MWPLVPLMKLRGISAGSCSLLFFYIRDLCLLTIIPLILTIQVPTFSEYIGVKGAGDHLRIHDRVQGHLRRHLLQQVVVYRRPGHVRPSGDQPGGEGGV